MRYFLGVLAFLVAFLTQTASVSAQDIPTGKFKGDYYNGRNFETFVFTREDPNIGFNWWMGSPGPGVYKDDFSVRWQGKIEFSAGDWEFGSMPDDGIRIFIDGEKMVDSWQLQHGTYFKFVKNLSAGTHTIVVEYFEARDWAGATLSWKKLRSGSVATVTTAPGTTPGVPRTIVPTTSPLYKSLYTSSCEELKAKPVTGDAPVEVDFSGAGYDPYGRIASYNFDFGDGQSDSKLSQEDSYATHIYKKPGTYTAFLTIKDSKGNLRTADVCKIKISVGGFYKEGVGGYAEPTVIPATASSLPATGIFDGSLSLLILTVPLAVLGILLNRKFSKM